ncbi:MAG: hypothetical protein M1305_05735 [Candidatus Marsarchaeota archaeon]|nr:hypothetical protein [Candidatus Marsarchaeota archaeon]
MKAGLSFCLLSSYVAFLYVLQVGVLGVSSFSMRISHEIAIIVLLSSILSAILFLARVRANVPKDVERFVEHRSRAEYILLSLTVVNVIAFAVLFVAAYVMPDLSGDSNTYHIPSIAMWESQGYVHWVETSYLPELINGYPKGAELVSYILVKAFANNQLINVVNLVFLPLGIFGIVYIASALGASPWIALFAGTSYVLIPVNINQAPTLYVDSAYASCAIAFLAALFHLIRRRFCSWSAFVVFGMAMALTLSVKSTGVVLCGIGILALGLAVFTEIRNSGRNVRLAFLNLSLGMLMVGALSLAGAYWYLRNYAETGTPLYPKSSVGLAVADKVLFPGQSVAESINQLSNTPLWMRSWPGVLRVLYTWLEGIQHWPSSVIYYADTREGGLGFIWLLGCVPATLIAITSCCVGWPKQRHLLILN